MTETFGVAPTVEGFSAFLNSLTRINQAYAKQAQSITEINQKAAQMGAAVDAATRKEINGANKAAEAFAKAFKSQGKANEAAARGIALRLAQDGKLAELEKLLQISTQNRAAEEARAGAVIEASRNRVILSTQKLAAAQRALAASVAGGGGAGGAGGGGGNFFASLSGFFGKAASAGKVVMGVFGGIGNAIKGLFAPLERLRSRFSFDKIFNVAAGVLIRDVIFGIMRSIKDAGSEVFKFAASLQTLQVRFETLISRELRQRDATLSVADSLAKAAPQARGLLEWIKQLSIIVPVDIKDIAATNAYAQAMGFTTSAAKELTTTILTFTAAMGLGSEAAERIVFNFGQMIAAGKLTQTELRDLARGALFPLQSVLDELAKSMGISGKGLIDLRKDAAAGKFDIQSFFKAFETVVERDFPGALKRMGETFTGAIVRMKNAVKVIGGDVFGPIIASIGVAMSNFLANLDFTKVREGAMIIGETLRRSFELVAPAISRLVSAIGQMLAAFGIALPSVQGLAEGIAFLSIAISKVADAVSGIAKKIGEKFGATFQALVRAAFAWGANIITSLARGMAAAITAVINVLIAIGSIIASWLKPGSPPKIAPLLDKWGASAATEWIRGWLKGDFSLFNQIADKVEAFLRSIPGGIGKDNKGLIPLILGTRATIAKAINQVKEGSITIAQAIDKVIKSAKKVTGEFRAYISALFSVAEAERRVEAASALVEQAQLAVAEASERTKIAQEQVKAITERYSAVLDDLRKQLSAVTEEFDDQVRLEKISAAIATGLLTDEEKRRLEMEKRAIEIKAQIRATEAQRDIEVGGAEAVVAAREAEEAALQRGLDLAEQQQKAAELQLKMAEDQLAAAEAAIDFQIKQNELLSEQLSLLEALAAAAAAAAGAGGEVPLAEALGLEGLGGLFEDLFDEAAIQAQVDTIFRNMLSKVVFWQGRIEQFFKESFGRIWAPGGPLDTLKTKFDEIIGSMATSQKLIDLKIAFIVATLVMTIMWETFANTMKARSSEIGDQLDILVGKFASLDLAGLGVNVTIGTLFAILSALTWPLAIISGAMQGFEDVLKRVNEQLDILMKPTETWGDAFMKTWIAVTFWGDLILTYIEGWVDGVIQFYVDLANELVNQSIVPQMMTDIYDTMTGTLTDIQTFFETTLTEIKTFFETKATEIKTFLSTKMTEMLDTVATNMTAIWISWSTWWGLLTTYLSTTVTTAIDNFKNNVLTPLKNFIATDLQNAVNNWKNNALEPLRAFIVTPLTNAIDGLREGPLKSIANFIRNTILGVFDDLKEKLDSIERGFNVVRSAVSALKSAVEALINKLRQLASMNLGPLQSGSPPPLAFALEDVNEQASKLANRTLVKLAKALLSIPDQVAINMSSLAGTTGMLGQSVVAGPSVSSNSIDRSIHVEINPTYRNVQSEASIFYDVAAALAAVR